MNPFALTAALAPNDVFSLNAAFSPNVLANEQVLVPLQQGPLPQTAAAVHIPNVSNAVLVTAASFSGHRLMARGFRRLHNNTGKLNFLKLRYFALLIAVLFYQQTTSVAAPSSGTTVPTVQRGHFQHLDLLDQLSSKMTVTTKSATIKFFLPRFAFNLYFEISKIKNDFTM